MIEPYYDSGGITIYHGDARDVLPVILSSLGAGVLVTDPPYGMSYVSNHSKYGSTRPITGDSDLTVREDVLRIWGGRPALVFGTWRCARPDGVVQLLVWDKGESPGMGDLGVPWGPAHEEIYVIGTGFVGKRRPNVLRYKTLAAGDAGRPDHPTPKPVPLMRDLIAYCPPGSVVVDPFAGSGTTLRAAKDLGRRAIGIEIEERYCEIAVKRLAQEVLL